MELPHCKGKNTWRGQISTEYAESSRKRNFKLKKWLVERCRNASWALCVLNQSPNEALDWMVVPLLEQLISHSLGILTPLFARSYKVLAYGSKRSLQLP